MTFEDLWEKYINEDILENYDSFKETFSIEIGAEKAEDYDIGELLAEFIGHYETAKEFEKILEFTKILRTNNKVHFDGVFSYYAEFLIEYYCYHKDAKNLQEPVNDFLEYPIKDYDYLLKSLRKLIYYGYFDLGNQLIENTYHIVSNTLDLMHGAEYDLALFKAQIELEKVYTNYQSTKTFEWTLYKQILKKFDFDTKEEYCQLIEHGFTRGIAEIEHTFPKEFQENRSQSIEKLEKGFMQYAKECKMSFPVSGTIYNYLYQYWEEKYKEGSKQQYYFKIDEKGFKQFIRSKSGFILDYRFESVLILWGSSHVYDFLKHAKIISIEDYNEAKRIISKFKKLLIDENLLNLWKYNFIHNWDKSEMVTEDEEIAEKEVFKESYQLTQKEAQPRLKRGFFMETLAETNQRLQSFEDIFSTPKNKKTRPKLEPSNLPKIGRNEKVTVKYKDGTIQKDIKFKRVMDDLEKGDCEII